MKETVYIETSVISYYISKPSRDLIIAGRQEITREKWPKFEEIFDRYISALVIQEAEQGDTVAAQQRLRAVERIPILEITESAEKLAGKLVSEKVIREKNIEDALHIAIASVNGIDYLLTWNFTHINNAQMKIKITTVVENQGYQCPIICSPEELLGEE